LLQEFYFARFEQEVILDISMIFSSGRYVSEILF